MVFWVLGFVNTYVGTYICIVLYCIVLPTSFFQFLLCLPIRMCYTSCMYNVDDCALYLYCILASLYSYYCTYSPRIMDHFKFMCYLRKTSTRCQVTTSTHSTLCKCSSSGSCKRKKQQKKVVMGHGSQLVHFSPLCILL